MLHASVQSTGVHNDVRSGRKSWSVQRPRKFRQISHGSSGVQEIQLLGNFVAVTEFLGNNVAY